MLTRVHNPFRLRRSNAVVTLLLLFTFTLVLTLTLAPSPTRATSDADAGDDASCNRTSATLSPDNSIYDNIRAIPSLSLLAKGLTYPQHTHLRLLLSSCRGVNYTVFAPSNWAVINGVREFNRTLVRSGYPTVDEIKRDLENKGVFSNKSGDKDNMKKVSESDSLARPEDQQLNVERALFGSSDEMLANEFGAVALFANPEEIRQHCSFHSADAEFAAGDHGQAGMDASGESDAEKEQTRHDKIPKGFNITNLILRYSKSAALYHVVVGSFPIAALPAHAFLPTLLRNDSALVALNGEPQRMHVENITAARLELEKSTPTLEKPFPVPALNYSTAIDMDGWAAASVGGEGVSGQSRLDVLETHSLARADVEAAARQQQQARLFARLQRWYAFEQMASDSNATGNLDPRITPIKILFGTAYDPLPQSTYDRLMQNATWPSLGVERYIASVVVPDIPCANGIIHIIDRVLEVPMNASLQLRRANLSSVADVLNKTNLTEQVHSMQNITLLVPSNEAIHTFVKGLGKNVSLASESAMSFASGRNGWARLLHVLAVLAADSQPIQQLPAANPQQQQEQQQQGGDKGDKGNATLTSDDIKKILLHHIVQGAYRIPEVPMNASLTTLTGGSLQLTVVNGSTVMINNASITKQNFLIRNGVMHEIDQVLVPEGIPGVSPPARGGGGGGASGGDSSKTQSTSSKFTLLSVTSEETAAVNSDGDAQAQAATPVTSSSLTQAPPAQGGVTVGLVQLPAGSAAPVYTAELKFANLSVSVIPASNSAAINATTLGCLASDLVCLAVDKTALECVTQLNLMSESEKEQCEKRAFRYTAMTDPATREGAAGNWGGDPLLNLPRTPTCFSPRTHTCVNGNFLCPLTHPFLCGAQCYSKGEYVCYNSFSMCPHNASSKCGFACYNEKQYACERGKLVSKGGGSRGRPVGAATATTASANTGANEASAATAPAQAPAPTTATPPAAEKAFFRNVLRTGQRWRN